jgi:electron transfer flavoprotein alpha subunit
MGNILAFCEYDGGTLKASALSNLTFARQAAAAHGGEVIALLIGAGAATAGAAAAAYAARVITVEHADLAAYLAETYAPIVARLAGEHGATVVCATATSVGKDLLPRVAALLDAGMASDISRIDAGNQFTRPILAGNAYATIEVSTPVVCVTVRQSEFAQAEPTGAAGAVTAADAGDLDAKGARIDRVESQKSARPELTSAEVRGLRRPRHGRGRQLQGPRGARRPAGRGAWARQPRGHRRRHGPGRSGRSARPARSSRPTSTSRSRSRAPSSTWPA